MTTRTTIPIDSHGNTGNPDGPIDCARCGLSLVDREPDQVDRDGTGTWEHDTGDGELAICGDCFWQSEQGHAWLGLARWRNRSKNRGFCLGRDGLTTYEGQVSGPTFAAPRAQLPAEDVLAWLATDPLRHENLVARLDRLVEKFEAEEACPETERNLEHGA